MPAIPRHPQKVFGQSLTPSGNVAVYGSLAAGAPTYPATTDDLTTIQSAEWLLGLNGALIGNRSPALEDLNGLFVVLSQQIAYLLQNGVPAWDVATTYYAGQLARIPGTAAVATSLTDNNVGNNPATSTANWSASGSSYPISASLASSQSVPVDGLGHTLGFDLVEVYPFSSIYDAGTYRYTVPVTGAYFITANLQADNVSGVAATMELSVTAVVNGSTIARAAGTSVASPPGSRWYPKLATMVPLNAGDTVEIQLTATDGVNSGSLTLSNSDWSIHKVP